jgi:hypothetical protein
VDGSAFNHNDAIGTCYSCHNGSRPPAIGKPRDHPNTSNVCEDCHTTRTFSK